MSMKLLIHIDFMVHCVKLVVVRVLWMDVTWLVNVLWRLFTFLCCLMQFCIVLLQNFVASFGIMKNKASYLALHYCSARSIGY